MIGSSLARRTLLPVLASGAVVAAVSVVVIVSGFDRSLHLLGSTAAHTAVGEARALRRFYTDEVAARAEQAGMRVDLDDAKPQNTLPLPGTSVKSMGQCLPQTIPGADVRLFSAYPFRRAAQRELDAFEQAAIAAIRSAGGPS